MSWFLSFYRSAVGKNAVMAVTGIMLFGFVFGHMLGNFKMYLGADSFNSYAEWLRNVGYPAIPHEGFLWIARVVLLGAVGLHILSATQLTLLNLKARPVNYRDRQAIQASYASRTMRLGGVIILLFVIYHLAHLTLGTAHPNFIHGDAFHNVVTGFQIWWVSAFYIVAQVALGFHLFHGLWSMFQSLGWWEPGKDKDWRRTFATIFAWVITIGNISFPLAVLAGVVS